MTYKTGQIIELHTPAHPHTDQQLGLTDPNCIVPAKTDRYRIARVAKSGDDIRLTLRDAENPGCGILVNRWLAYKGWGRTLRVIG